MQSIITGCFNNLLVEIDAYGIDIGYGEHGERYTCLRA
jgi:hypothetical protein